MSAQRFRHSSNLQASKLPALVKTGCRDSGGAVGSKNGFSDQHHPGATRHPSSPEEGSFWRTRWRLAVWSVVATCWLALGVYALPQSRGTAPTPASQAKPLTKDQLDFFESKIRPIFTDNCYQCHSP